MLRRLLEDQTPIAGAGLLADNGGGRQLLAMAGRAEFGREVDSGSRLPKPGVGV